LYAGRYDDAIKCLKEVLELDPSNSMALNNMGLAHIQKGMIHEGLEEVKRAAQTQETPAPSSDLAYAYTKAGQPEEARNILTALLKSDESKPLPYATIAGVYAAL
jgi:Flp pilus assembly protein TadD